jgi:RNA polymerase sigma factor (sigma-70 family)
LKSPSRRRPRGRLSVRSRVRGRGHDPRSSCACKSWAGGYDARVTPPAGPEELSRAGGAQFTTTHWSVVLAAGQGTASPRAAAALEKLCQAYWYPLYAYVRRRGHSPEDAQDLTQEFLARFLESAALQGVSPAKGRFRSYVLASLNHFLANAWNRAHTRKRGGHARIVSLDEGMAEERFRLEPATDLTPEKLFDRRWALALLDQALRRLEQEWTEDGKSGLFQHLRGFLAEVKGAVPYAEVARQAGISEAAARQAVHRLRRRYRDLLRREIAHTVDRPDEVEDELRHLFAAFA